MVPFHTVAYSVCVIWHHCDTVSYYMCGMVSLWYIDILSVWYGTIVMQWHMLYVVWWHCDTVSYPVCDTEPLWYLSELSGVTIVSSLTVMPRDHFRICLDVSYCTKLVWYLQKWLSKIHHISVLLSKWMKCWSIKHSLLCDAISSMKTSHGSKYLVRGHNWYEKSAIASCAISPLCQICGVYSKKS